MSEDEPARAPRAVVAGLSDLLAGHGTEPYREFLRVPALSLGLFAAPAGHLDFQRPHARDEVYVVLEGSGTLEADGHRTPVSAGTVAYVPAGTDHRMADVGEPLRVVVVFAPPVA